MIDPEVLKRELFAACRQRGKNVEFTSDPNKGGFNMTVTPSLGAAVFVSEDELSEETDMSGFIATLLEEAGII